MDLLISNARLGLVLVFICLSFFLDLKLAFWVMMGIPISFLGAFLLMEPFDASINMLSLFAFIVALGIVVDDAIIVGENVYAHREKGKNFLRAAIDGALSWHTRNFFHHDFGRRLHAFILYRWYDGQIHVHHTRHCNFRSHTFSHREPLYLASPPFCKGQRHRESHIWPTL